MSKARIGFIGVGNMGKGMIGNLIKAKHPETQSSLYDVHIYNRTLAKSHEFLEQNPSNANKNLFVAKTLPELVSKSDVVMACLTNVKSSQEVFLGENGIISGSAKEGTIFIDHSTVDIETSQTCHKLAQQAKSYFLDAPISGGPEGAKNGTLSIMVGGQEEIFEKVKPILSHIGKNVIHMGPGGNGTAMKLVNQLLTCIHVVASCEAMLVGTQCGLDLDKMKAVLSNSYGNSTMLMRTIDKLKSGATGPGTGAPIRNLAKDLTIIEDLASKLKLGLPVTEMTDKVFQSAMNSQLAEHDIAYFFNYLNSQGSLK